MHCLYICNNRNVGLYWYLKKHPILNDVNKNGSDSDDHNLDARCTFLSWESSAGNCRGGQPFCFQCFLLFMLVLSKRLVLIFHLLCWRKFILMKWMVLFAVLDVSPLSLSLPTLEALPHWAANICKRRESCILVRVRSTLQMSVKRSSDIRMHFSCSKGILNTFKLLANVWGPFGEHYQPRINPDVNAYFATITVENVRSSAG